MWLLLTHAAALAAFWWLPGWAARRDAALFTANPASDDYHKVFHRQRLLERVGIFVGLALVASLPLLLGHKTDTTDTMSLCMSVFVSVLGLLSAAAGMWAYRFNPLLNEARNLFYVPKWYVSPDPRAAYFPDRFIWNKAVAAVPPGIWSGAELLSERNRYAGKLLRRVLRVALGAGLVGYAAALVLIWLRLPVAG